MEHTEVDDEDNEIERKYAFRPEMQIDLKGFCFRIL